MPRRGGRRLSPGAHAAPEVTFPTGCERAPGVPGGWPGPLPPARCHARREAFLKGAGGTEDFATAPGAVRPWDCAPPGLVTSPPGAGRPRDCAPGPGCQVTTGAAGDSGPSVLPPAASDPHARDRPGAAHAGRCEGLRRDGFGRARSTSPDTVSRRGQGLGRRPLVPGPLRRLQQVGTSQNSVKSRRSVSPGDT